MAMGKEGGTLSNPDLEMVHLSGTVLWISVSSAGVGKTGHLEAGTGDVYAAAGGPDGAAVAGEGANVDASVIDVAGTDNQKHGEVFAVAKTDVEQYAAAAAETAVVQDGLGCCGGAA